MAMPRVALLGANGQVGSEVTILLSEMEKVEPIAVGRSAYGLALLDKLGIACRVSPSLETIKDATGDCAVVVDLALPMYPDTKKTRDEIRRRAEAVVAAAQPGATIVFTSTMAVYQLDPDGPRHTIYGATKRYAERCYQQACKRRGSRLFVLRLGQVHGAMQSATLGIFDTLRRTDRISVPGIPSIAVFCSTIAEAVENIAEGRNEPGTYSLYSTPEYSFVELTEWLASEADTTVRIDVENTAPPAGVRAKAIGRLRSAVGRAAEANKDLLVDVGSHLAPRRIEQARFDRHVRTAQQAVAASLNAGTISPFVQKTRPLGARLEGLSDPRESMPERHRSVKARLSRLSEMIE